MSINEKSATIYNQKIKMREYNLRKKTSWCFRTIAFKAENDDIRDSLSIKLLKKLKIKKN